MDDNDNKVVPITKDKLEVDHLDMYKEKISITMLTTIGDRMYVFLDNVKLHDDTKILEFNRLIDVEGDGYSINSELIVTEDSFVQVPVSSIDSLEVREVYKHKIKGL